MREQLFDSTKLVQTFFHSCGHSNVASNGHSTLRKLLMAIMDYHFVSSNSFEIGQQLCTQSITILASCYIPQIVTLPQSTCHKLAEENMKTDIAWASKHIQRFKWVKPSMAFLAWSNSYQLYRGWLETKWELLSKQRDIVK